jgi:hypothetical protein
MALAKKKSVERVYTEELEVASVLPQKKGSKNTSIIVKCLPIDLDRGGDYKEDATSAFWTQSNYKVKPLSHIVSMPTVSFKELGIQAGDFVIDVLDQDVAEDERRERTIQVMEYTQSEYDELEDDFFKRMCDVKINPSLPEGQQELTVDGERIYKNTKLVFLDELEHKLVAHDKVKAKAAAPKARKNRRKVRETVA